MYFSEAFGWSFSKTHDFLSSRDMHFGGEWFGMEILQLLLPLEHLSCSLWLLVVVNHHSMILCIYIPYLSIITLIVVD